MELTKETFETEIQKKELMLVDFWAEWCGPCQALKPIIEELEKDYEKNDKVGIAQCNIDECPEVAEKYEIQSIPTIILFQKGKEKERINGLQGKESIAELIEKY